MAENKFGGNEKTNLAGTKNWRPEQMWMQILERSYTLRHGNTETPRHGDMETRREITRVNELLALGVPPKGLEATH